MLPKQEVKGGTRGKITLKINVFIEREEGKHQKCVSQFRQTKALIVSLGEDKPFG